MNYEFTEELRSSFKLGTHNSALSIHYFCFTKIGGGSRGRTGDIQLAKLALCQLSYAPGETFTLVIATTVWLQHLSNAALKRPFEPFGPEGIRNILHLY